MDMSDKQKDTLTGQVVATCIVTTEVRRELLQSGASDEVNKAARGAQDALRKLLRAVGYTE